MHVSRPLKDGQKISQGHRLSSLNFIQMNPRSLHTKAPTASTLLTAVLSSQLMQARGVSKRLASIMSFHSEDYVFRSNVKVGIQPPGGSGYNLRLRTTVPLASSYKSEE
jgi:hypothetical protein